METTRRQRHAWDRSTLQLPRVRFSVPAPAFLSKNACRSYDARRWGQTALRPHLSNRIDAENMATITGGKSKYAILLTLSFVLFHRPALLMGIRSGRF